MQLVADKHDHDDSETQTPEHDVQTDMLGAYGEFGYDDWLMGDELPKDASAQRAAAWRTRNESAFFELLDSHPYFAQSLVFVPPTPVPTQCFRRRSDGAVWKWMARIRMYIVKASGQAPKRGAESGKRKQPPAKSSERCPSHAVRGACEWGAPCCKQRNAVRGCWVGVASSTARTAAGASITMKTHQTAVTHVLLCAAVLCDACTLERCGWFIGGVRILKK